MTGFSRAEGRLEGFSWAWELRSVNAKSLDIRLRLPHGLDFIEAVCKQILGTVMVRGSISATLSIDEKATATALRINETVLTQVVHLLNSLEGRIDAAPPRLDGLLAIRGVMELGAEEVSPDTVEARHTAIEAGFRDAAAALSKARCGEGARIAQVLENRLQEISDLIAQAELSAAAQPAELLARFRRQMATLLDSVPALPEEKLVQEAALLIARADIREELDRLTAHSSAARELLAEGLNIGRRLDFLCQEFNREANTICSKSADLGLTRIGLALKAAIEQLREQVQNIE